MKKIVVALIVFSLAVLPAFAGAGCAKKVDTDKKGCSPAQRLACSTPCASKTSSQCADIEKKIADLKKMRGANSKEMKAVIDILESMIKCQKQMCSTNCGSKKVDSKAVYSCPKCKGKNYMKPGKCTCGATLVKK